MGGLIARMALLLAEAAVVGFLLGRLIRGRTPTIELTRPRIAISAAYLRDAHNKALSAHTRATCAFEALYYCCCEVAESQGLEIVTLAHPSEDVIRAGLKAIAASNQDCDAVRLLAGWASTATAALPDVTIHEVCKLAARIHAKTVLVLS